MYNDSLSIKLFVKQINKQVKKRFAVTVTEEKIMLPSVSERQFTSKNHKTIVCNNVSETSNDRLTIIYSGDKLWNWI